MSTLFIRFPIGLLSLKITDLDALAHLFERLRQFLHQIHLDIEVDRQVGILVGGVDGFPHVEIDIGGFLKQQAADEGRAVLTVVPPDYEVSNSEALADGLHFG